MKESKLVLKMKRIEEKLEKSKIINKCYQAARDHGKGRKDVGSSKTVIEYNLVEGALKIHLYDGGGQGGAGQIEVDYRGRKVLYGDRYALDKAENKLYPEVDRFCILTYISGPWEKEVDEILNPKPVKKIPEPPKDPEISSSVLEKLQSRFSGL